MVDSQEKDSLYFPKIESKYWDLQRETMKEKERNKVILKKLKDQLWYAYNNSPYYHNLYNKISLDINSIKSLVS